MQMRFCVDTGGEFGNKQDLVPVDMEPVEVGVVSAGVGLGCPTFAPPNLRAAG